MSEERPPHPDTTRQPSPARGEGTCHEGRKALGKLSNAGVLPGDTAFSGEGKDTQHMKRAGHLTKMSSLGARSKVVLGATTQPSPATTQPSPLVGEGGAIALGEGDTATPPKHRHRDIARKLRRTMTDAERKLWSLLRNRKLSSLKFRRQVPLGPYIADFLSFEPRCIIEADGSQHSADVWFASKGFRIVRFWNNEILTNPEGVLQRIVELTAVHLPNSSASTPIRIAHE